MVETVQVIPLGKPHRPWALALLEAEWGSRRVVTRGVLYDLGEMPGLVALRNGELVGLLTYRLEADACEVMSLNSVVENVGAGTALIAAVQVLARQAGCRRLWLITTNDNVHALRFYQKRGFCLAALHRRALDVSRRLKPEIPAVGFDGIPLRDEIELEVDL